MRYSPKYCVLQTRYESRGCCFISSIKTFTHRAFSLYSSTELFISLNYMRFYSAPVIRVPHRVTIGFGAFGTPGNFPLKIAIRFRHFRIDFISYDWLLENVHALRHIRYGGHELSMSHPITCCLQLGNTWEIIIIHRVLMIFFFFLITRKQW